MLNILLLTLHGQHQNPLKNENVCFNTFTSLYEKKDSSQKMKMKNKIHNLKMDKDKTMASFFTNISHVRDQLTRIGVVVDKDDLIHTVETFMGDIPSCHKWSR